MFHKVKLPYHLQPKSLLRRNRRQQVDRLLPRPRWLPRHRPEDEDQLVQRLQELPRDENGIADSGAKALPAAVFRHSNVPESR